MVVVGGRSGNRGWGRAGQGRTVLKLDNVGK